MKAINLILLLSALLLSVNRGQNLLGSVANAASNALSAANANLNSLLGGNNTASANASSAANSTASAGGSGGSGGSSASANSSSSSNASANGSGHNGGGSASANSSSSSSASANGNGGGSSQASSSSSSQASASVNYVPSGVSQFPLADTDIAFPNCFWPWYRFCYYVRVCDCQLEWPWNSQDAMASAQMDPNAVSNYADSLQQPGSVDDAEIETGESSRGMDQSIYFPQCYFPYEMNCYWVERCYCRIGWSWYQWMQANPAYCPAATN
jgi:hypothetical protein